MDGVFDQYASLVTSAPSRSETGRTVNKLGLGCTPTGFVLPARTVSSHRHCQAFQSSALMLPRYLSLAADLQPHPAGRPS